MAVKSTGPSVAPAAASPTPHTTAVIDHDAFPHIIDAIFKHAPYESLLVLRQASWAWCTRVDRQMCRSIKVSGQWTTNGGPLKDALAYETDQGHKLPLIEGYKHSLPLIHPRKRRSSKLYDNRVHDALQGTQLLHFDVVANTFGRPGLFVNFHPRTMSSLRCVKFAPGPDQISFRAYKDEQDNHAWAPCEVLFTDVDTREGWASGNLRPCRRPMHSFMDNQTEIPEGTERTVINITDHYLDDTGRTCHLAMVRGLTEHPLSLKVVVILHPLSARSQFSGSTKGLGILWWIVMAAFHRGPRIKYKIVGAESIEPSFLCVSPGLSTQQLKDEMQSGIRNVASIIFDPDTAVGMFEILTRQEYIDKVGQEQWQFETEF